MRETPVAGVPLPAFTDCESDALEIEALRLSNGGGAGVVERVKTAEDWTGAEGSWPEPAPASGVY